MPSLSPVRRRAGLVVNVCALVLVLTGAEALSAVAVPARPTAGSSPPAASPAAEAPATRDRLDRRELRRLLRQVVRTGGVGAVAEVDARGQEFRGAAGRATIQPRRPARASARYRTASISKMLVSVLALQLVDRGRWTLDTTIDDVRPGLYPGRGDVTVRQLLSHTSGLPDYLLPLVAGATTNRQLVRVVSRRRTDAQLVRLARTQPPTGVPGGAFSYSNTNFVVVGMMLERATGQSLGRLMKRRILGPAGMTQSAWPSRRGLPAPRLHEYYWGLPTQAKWIDLGRFSPTTFSAAGALVTTTRDTGRFQRALSSHRLLPRRLVRQMRTVQAVDPVVGLEYGLGSYRLPDPCSDPSRPRWVYGHDGASFGTLSFTMASPGGRRRATAAVTGRFRSPETNVALIELVYAGLSQRCGAGPAQRAESRWPVRQLAQSLADRLG